MAIHEPLESLTQQAESFVPFSNEDIQRLRYHILMSSGAFDDQAIAEQVSKDTEACLLSKCVTLEVIQNREIDPIRIAWNLEKEWYESVHLLDEDFYDFLGDIKKVNDNLERLATKTDKKNSELYKKLDELFTKDPILISLAYAQGELQAGRSFDGVPANEVATTITSLNRSIMAQKAVLVGINYPELSTSIL